MPTIDRTGVTYHDASNARIRKIGRMVGPASYATGGDACSPSLLGLGKVDVLLLQPFTNGTVIILAVYVVSTSLVKFFDMAGAEIANGTDLSAYSARFEAIGY